jgi:excisionase family DNA binding protein
MPSRGDAKPKTTPTPDVMTIDQLAAYLQIAKSSLYKLAQEGKVPGQKVGKHWRFKKDAIDRWLEDQPEGRNQ